MLQIRYRGGSVHVRMAVGDTCFYHLKVAQFAPELRLDYAYYKFSVLRKTTSAHNKRYMGLLKQ